MTLHYLVIGFGSGLCAILVFVGIGCGARSKPVESASAQEAKAAAPLPLPPVPQPQPPAPERPTPKPPAPKPPRKEPPPAPPATGPVAFDGLTNTLANDYLNDADRADGKYKDKRVRLRGRIDHIGRRDGVAFLGYSARGGGPDDMTMLFLFAEDTDPAAMGVKKGQIAVIEGTCRGRSSESAMFPVRIEGCKFMFAEDERR